jgi:hypothetical protein
MTMRIAAAALAGALVFLLPAADGAGAQERVFLRGAPDVWAKSEQLGERPALDAESVAEVQGRLADMGYDVGQPSGELGNRTRRAIAAYQADAGLEVTGEPDLEFLAHLRTAARPPAQAITPRQARAAIGRPVYGTAGGDARIGRVVDVVTAADGSISALAVAVEKDGGETARLSVPWSWVRTQIGNPTIMLPWSRAEVDWLTGG